MLPIWDLQTRRRAPVVTLLLVAALALVFGYQWWLSLQGGGALERLIADGGLVPAEAWRQWAELDPWRRVFTSMVLHGGLAHLAANGWFLWVFGAAVEARLGAWRYVALYAAAGVGAALLQVAADPSSLVPMIGASGAISGVLGAYLRLFPKAWVLTLVPWIVPVVPVPAVVFLVLWFVVQMLQGLETWLAPAASAGGGVAWWAHAGGFVTGWLLARLVGAARGRRRARRG